MICPNCKQNTTSYTGVIRNGEYIEFCEHCYSNPTQNLSATFKRNKDIVAINQNSKEGVYGVDKNGKHVSLKDTPYEYDPTGWKYAHGSKIKKKIYIT